MDSLAQNKDPGIEERREEIRAKLRQVIEGREFPALPSLVNRVLQMLEDPDLNIRRLSQLLSDDPELAARILATARSAYYGQRVLPTTLQAAIQVMGLRDLRNLVISVVTRGLFNSKGPVADALWSHSLGVALGCRILSSYFKQRDSEQAFLAGLLHDVGQMMLLYHDRESFIHIIRESSKQKVSLATCEREFYGVDHATLGAMLLEYWELDKEVCQAVGTHHNPDLETEPRSLSAMLVVADYLAFKASLGFYAVSEPPPAAILRAFACDKDEVQAQAVAEIREAFDSESVILKAI